MKKLGYLTLLAPLLAVMMLFVLTIPLEADANTFTVNSTADAVDANPAARQSPQGLLDITTGLKGYWKFDANANDFSGNNYHGTLTNGALIDNAAGTNKVGAGKLSLDGTNDYVELSAYQNNFGSLTVGTISAWIKTSVLSSTYAIIFEVSDTADAQSIARLYVDSGKLCFRIYEHSTEQLGVYSAASVNNNAWHHVAVTVAATGNKLYIDGVQAAVSYYLGNAATQKFFNNVTGIDFMGIGIDKDNSGIYYAFPGLIDDVRVYDRALSAADITELFTNPLPIQLATFVGRASNGNNILLEWTTLTETNNYGFEVQRKKTGDADFAGVPNNFVPGHGTTLQPQQYTFTDASVTAGQWSYRLKQIDLDGTVHYTDAVSVDVLTDVKDQNTPTTFALEQNYPNPFNPSTEISYELAGVGGQGSGASNVKLAVYDLLGREVAVLVNERQVPGSYSVRFNANGLASGIYLYKLTAGSFTETKRLTLLK